MIYRTSHIDETLTRYSHVSFMAFGVVLHDTAESFNGATAFFREGSLVSFASNSYVYSTTEIALDYYMHSYVMVI